MRPVLMIAPWIAVLLTLLVAERAYADEPAIALDPPPPGVFVIDHAGLLDDEQRRTLDALGAALLEEQRTPLIVVTIESMAAYWPYGGIRIETFAHLLFDQWEIGIADLAGETWNTGILLLVSRDDRRARIQLGAGWGRSKDAACSRIMDKTIIPQFKRGRFGRGIVNGARAIDAMARERDLPAGAERAGGAAGGGASPGRRAGGFGLGSVAGCFGVGVLIVVVGAGLLWIFRRRADKAFRSYRSLGEANEDQEDDDDRGGKGGGKGGFWSGWLMGQLISTRGGGGLFGSGGHSGGSQSSFGSGFSGGGFSGGGFSGGGFSGGGGASGGW